MIVPTIGRKVWFWEHAPKDGEQPLDATIVYVWSARLVNLFVVDHDGRPSARTSVPLLQDADPKPAAGMYAEWMGYQLGQAARTEQAEARAGKP